MKIDIKKIEKRIKVQEFEANRNSNENSKI